MFGGNALPWDAPSHGMVWAFYGAIALLIVLSLLLIFYYGGLFVERWLGRPLFTGRHNKPEK